MTTVNEHIAAIKAALAAGPTPGPWYASSNGLIGGYCVSPQPAVAQTQRIMADYLKLPDARFIAAAHPDALQAIIAAYEQVVAEVKTLTEQRDQYRRDFLAEQRENMQAQMRANRLEAERNTAGQVLHVTREALEEAKYERDKARTALAAQAAMTEQMRAALVDIREQRFCEDDCTNFGCCLFNALAITPTAAEQQVTALRKATTTLFDSIAHGDEAHRQWLRDAIANHFRNAMLDEQQAALATTDTEAVATYRAGQRVLDREWLERALLANTVQVDWRYNCDTIAARIIVALTQEVQ